MCFSPQRRAILAHQMFEKCSETDVFCTFLLQNVRFRHSGVHFFDIWTSKSASETWRALYIFTSKCAFRHSGVQFFDIWTSKSAPKRDVFCTFSLQNVLFATAACNFWFLLWAHDLRTRRFNRPTFGLTRHTNHWKNTAFRDFSNIWRGCIFFLLTFALLHLLSADLTTLLCFSTVHIVGSFYLNFLRLMLLLVLLLLVAQGRVDQSWGVVALDRRTYPDMRFR